MARELDVCTKTVWNWENDVVRPQWRHQSRGRRSAKQLTLREKERDLHRRGLGRV